MTDALVVVAHPDDETIWMGGTILKNKDWNWTVVSMCRDWDTDRAPKFKRVCEAYGARGIISDMEDEKLEPLEINKVADKLKSLLQRKKFDKIITHGENGEYGHIRHKETHQAVKKLIGDGDLEGNEIKVFSYLKGEEIPPVNPDTRVAIPNPNADESIVLSEEILKKKRELVRDMYGYPEQGFEVMCCNKREAFDKLK